MVHITLVFEIGGYVVPVAMGQHNVQVDSLETSPLHSSEELPICRFEPRANWEICYEYLFPAQAATNLAGYD